MAAATIVISIHHMLWLKFIRQSRKEQRKEISIHHMLWLKPTLTLKTVSGYDDFNTSHVVVKEKNLMDPESGLLSFQYITCCG